MSRERLMSSGACATGDVSSQPPLTLIQRPFEARRRQAQPEIVRSDSSPRVRSA
jgi:hypothetical protein